MWTEVIIIAVSCIFLYLIGIAVISWLQSRRKPEDKVVPLAKDFWNQQIENQSKVNPASREYQNSSTKRAADKRKQEYHQKNPPAGKSPVQHIKITTKNTRRSENSRPIDNIAVVPSPYLDDNFSDNSNSSSSSHSHSSFGHGGAFGGGGAAGYWGSDSHSSDSHTSSSHSDSSSYSSDSGSSDCGGGDGGGGD